MRARIGAAVAAVLMLSNQAGAQRPACAPDNGGFTLPAGFCAVVVAESLGPVRHIAVAPNGDIYAARQGPEGGVMLLRDTNGDGKVDMIRRLYAVQGGGSGIAIGQDALFFGANDRILRFNWPSGQAEPDTAPITIVRGLPVGGHAAKGITVGRDGRVYVSIGSLTNSCQMRDRANQSAGNQPCFELEQRAGIWRFDPKQEGQAASLASRYATGLRNPMAVSIDPGTGTLYAGVHGRDGLTEQWGWPAEQGRENPAEVVFALPEGADGGWPYCFADSKTGQRVQNPEYGGDGTKPGDCGNKAAPALTFPGHWAPMATAFYSGTQFPAAFRGGLFVSFHGSWNRAPAPQEGFRVVFAPFQGGKAKGTYETFAIPTAGPGTIRPVGLAVGPDGSLYLGADQQGKIWRVVYTGN